MFRSSHARVVLAPLLALLLPFAARASITPDAQAVVERYLKAVGGREAVASERSLHVKGTISAFGLAGTIESWTQRPDRSASVTTIGPFTIREAVDGATAWRVDQNGKFTRLDGKDLEDALASAYFENDLWVTPDQGGAAIAKVGAERDSAGSYVVLEVTPPVGRPRRLWFSEKTGLLDRVVSKRDQQTMTDFMFDYRTVAGRKRPHGNRLEVEGMAMNTARLTLDSVWVNPTMDPSTFTAAETAVSDTRFLAGRGPATIPVAYRVRHVWLKASVNGAAPEEFLLDTGASITVIDSAYAAQHGMKTEGQIGVTGAGAAGGASFASLDSIVVRGADGNGVVVAGQKVGVLALNAHLEPFFWKPVAGVLGYDFISRFVMTVDYDRQVLTLRDPKGFHYEGNGAALPMTMAGNIPVVKAQLDGDLDGDFRLDVGSGSTVDLHSPFVRKQDLKSRVGKTIDVLGGGFGGTFTSSLCRMKRFQLGKYSWNEPLAVLSQAETGGLASEDYAGNIGNHVLERFVCTFDYEHRMVYLEPGRRIAQRDQFSLAGFQMAKFGDRFTAMQVLSGSAADKAGLRSGDRVVAIDGKPVTADRGEELRAMFEDGKPGTKHTLDIVRDGKKKKLNLTMAEML
jgi:hypothetical protein